MRKERSGERKETRKERGRVQAMFYTNLDLVKVEVRRDL